MKTDDTIEDDLRNEAPLLFSREKSNPFEVPEGYFEVLSSNIQDKIAAEKSIPAWKHYLQSIFKPVVLIPVASCLIIMTFFLVKNNISSNNQIEIASLENVLVEDLYYSDYLTQIDIQTLAEAMPENSVSIEKTEMENYLIDHNVSIEDLSSQLNN